MPVAKSELLEMLKVALDDLTEWHAQYCNFCLEDCETDAIIKDMQKLICKAEADPNTATNNGG